MVDLYFVMKILTIVACALSVVGAIFNVLTTIYLRASTEIMQKMVIYLSIADIINSATVLLQILIPTSGDLFCQSSTFVNHIGFGSSLVLTCCFAHILHVSMNSPLTNPEIFLKRYQVGSLGFGLVLAVIAVITRVNETYYGYCSFHMGIDGFDWATWLALIIPLTVSVAYCGGIYIAVIRQLRELGKRLYIELLLYPIILVICYFPLIVMSLIEFPSIWFMLVAFTLSNCQGLFNALTYGLSSKIINGYREKCCRRQKQRRDTNESSSDDLPRSYSLAAMPRVPATDDGNVELQHTLEDDSPEKNSSVLSV